MAQYLNNQFTPSKQIDVTPCININTVEKTVNLGKNCNNALDSILGKCAVENIIDDIEDTVEGAIDTLFGTHLKKDRHRTETIRTTNITADPQCIFDTYKNNGLNPPIINESIFSDSNPNYNLTYTSDPIIDNYKSNYAPYSNDLVNISNINNNLSQTLSQNDINYSSTVTAGNDNLFEQSTSSINQKEDEMVSNLIEKFENNIDNRNYYNNSKLFILLLIIFFIFFIVYFLNKK